MRQEYKFATGTQPKLVELNSLHLPSLCVMIRPDSSPRRRTENSTTRRSLTCRASSTRCCQEASRKFASVGPMYCSITSRPHAPR